MKLFFFAVTLFLIAVGFLPALKLSWSNNLGLVTTKLEIAARLILSVILGSLIGIERTRAHKQAGVRTFALVALGACLFVLLEQLGFGREVDSARVISQIVVGIGFLGAGIILLQEDKVVGLTTAAGLWVTAAIGASLGLGLYGLGLFSAGVTLFILHYLIPLESKIRNAP